MKLMTKEIERKAPALYSTEKETDPRIVAKYFTPWTNWTWYMTEYDPVERLAFGLVEGFEKELGYFSLAELESVKGPFGLGIERDLHFGEHRLSEYL